MQMKFFLFFFILICVCKVLSVITTVPQHYSQQLRKQTNVKGLVLLGLVRLLKVFPGIKLKEEQLLYLIRATDSKSRPPYGP